MKMLKSFALLLTVGVMGAMSTGCSDPCGDLKAFCVAIYKEAGADESVCDVYDDADSDACEKAKDTVKAAIPEGADVPSECEF